MTLRPILLCALVGIVFPSVLSAGTQITMTKKLASSVSTFQVYLQNGSLRIEKQGREGPVLYLSDDRFLVLDPAHKTYMDMYPMTGTGGPKTGVAEPPIYRKIASGVSVNGYTTDEYEVRQGGKTVAEIWMADLNTLNLDPSDAAVYWRMVRKVMVMSQARGRHGFAFQNAPEGLPVRAILHHGEQSTETDEMIGITHLDLPASMFEVPKDYQPIRSID